MQSLTAIKIRNLLFQVAPRVASTLQREAIKRSYLKPVQKTGYTLPLPSLLKRSMIRQLALDHGASVLVETGTYKGDTPWELADAFTQIHTIEVMPVLADLAKKRLSGLKHVTVHEGDSSSILPGLVPSLRETTLFWLDGHCSDGVTGQGEAYCPIFAELRSIFLDRKDDCYLMIDDARFFHIPGSGYPSMESLVECVSQLAPQYGAVEFNDVIFVAPRSRLGQSSFLPKFLV